jgi:hypothetical protein
MEKKEIKQLIKNEITPLLIGIRNDLDEYRSKFVSDDSEIAGVVIHIPNKGDQGDKGDDGYTPISDKDYPSEKTVFNFIKENLPKRGKDYFTDADIKGIVKNVLSLIPKPKDGKNGVVDYKVVKDLATPLISAKYNELKSYVDRIGDALIQKINNSKQPELTAEKIRNKLEGLKGNARLDVKAIKGLEKFIGGYFPTSTGGGGGQRVDLSGYFKVDQSTPQTVLGNLVSLAGTGVSNLVVNADTGGSTIPPLGGFDIRWTARVTAYKQVGVEIYFYDSVTSAPVTISGADDYDLTINWDNLAGADGYMLQIEVYFPAIATTFQAFTDAYRKLTTNSYVAVSNRPYNNGSDAVNWFMVNLDASNNDYYETAITTAGAINLTEGGIINIDGSIFAGKKSGNNFFVGSNTFNGTESFAFGSSNILGDPFTAGGLVIGKSNTLTTGLVVGSSNIMTSSGIVLGNSNTLSNATILGSSNISNFSGDILIANGFATLEQSAMIGLGGSLGSINKSFGMNITSGNFGTFTQKSSFGVELNKSTVIEDITKDTLGSLFKNSLMANAGTDWILGVAWRKTSFVRYEKYQDGTSTLTPSNNPIVAGRRYLVQIRFTSDYTFVGTVTVTAGGVTLGTFSKDGTYTATFTALNTNTLTFTPTNTSRFSVYGVYLEEITAGDLTVYGNVNIGNAYNISTDGEATLGSINLTTATRGLEKIRNGSLVATGGTTGVALIGWTLASGWTYDNTNSKVLKSANGTGTLTQTLANMYTEFVVGKVYELVYTISNWTVGTVTPTVAGVSLTVRGANGTYTEQFTAVSNTALAFTPSNTARFTIDDISIKRVLVSGVTVDGNVGVSGTFTTVDLKTVTVTKGIITSIV